MNKPNSDSYIKETFLDLFKNNVNKYKDKIAVRHSSYNITYSELEEKSNRLAEYIVGKGLKNGDIVAIKLDRCTNAVIAMIGVWKSSCAFVFLDKNYPEERLNYIVKECRCKLVISEDFIDNLDNIVKGKPQSLKPNDLAAVIFTSGSTGKPKGVMLLHKNIAAMAKSYDFFHMDDNTILGVFANFCFVAIITDIFATLTAGGTVDIIPDNIRKNIVKLSKYYIDNKITITFLPPHMASKFTKVDSDNNTLKTLIVGSEQARNLYKRHYDILHVYGSSESCSSVAKYYIDSKETSYPIGKFKKDIKFYILDDEEKQVEKGKIGELCLSGPQISAGYLNNSEKTSACYVKNDFSNDEEFDIMFKTGDLVKELSDGNIQYISRKDWMFKIRGFRVEATEVEIAILKYPGVIEAAVTAFVDSGGTNILCGYYTSETEIDPLNIKNFLNESLPAYMVPLILIQLNEFPRNHNNKINKNVLPKPNIDKFLNSASI